MGKNKQNTTEELTKFEKKWLRAEGNPHLVRLPSYSPGNFSSRRMVQGLTKWILTRLELRSLDRELSALTNRPPTAPIIHYSPLSSPFVTVWRAVLLFLPTPVFFWICCLRLWWITGGRWRRRRRGGRSRWGRVGLDTSGFINMHTVCYLCYLRSFFLYKNTMNHISTLGGGGGGGRICLNTPQNTPLQKKVPKQITEGFIFRFLSAEWGSRIWRESSASKRHKNVK